MSSLYKKREGGRVGEEKKRKDGREEEKKRKRRTDLTAFF